MTTNSSAVLAETFAEFSKSVYNVFAEVENQSRLEVQAERDKVARDLRAATLEAQGWKQEVAEAKAAMAQAELTIAHQAANIAELRREVSQWKDQSRNWQDHFLRVEQVRCTQSSRIDELLKLQCIRPLDPTLFTPKQKYASVTHTLNSAPSSITTKEPTIPSPTQPPSYKSAAPRSTSDTGSSLDTSSPPSAKSKQGTMKHQRDTPRAIAATSSSQRQDRQTPAASRTTLIRHVQAIVHVKREESDDDSEGLPATTDLTKGEASDEDEIVGTNQRRSSRKNRRIIQDDDDVEQNYLAADGNPVWESRHLRHRNAIVNYQETDDEDDDELMMGAEENHEEVYGTQRVAQRSKQQHPHSASTAASPPKKKRKLPR